MASADVVSQILEFAGTSFVYLLPVIGILAGINFIFTWVMSLTMGLGRRTFRG
jgi:hypothetical protein